MHLWSTLANLSLDTMRIIQWNYRCFFFPSCCKGFRGSQRRRRGLPFSRMPCSHISEKIKVFQMLFKLGHPSLNMIVEFLQHALRDKIGSRHSKVNADRL